MGWLYFDNLSKCDKVYQLTKVLKRSILVKEQLKEAGMILDPNPIDQREEELRSICRSLGLTEEMPDMPKNKISVLT